MCKRGAWRCEANPLEILQEKRDSLAFFKEGRARKAVMVNKIHHSPEWHIATATVPHETGQAHDSLFPSALK